MIGLTYGQFRMLVSNASPQLPLLTCFGALSTYAGACYVLDDIGECIDLRYNKRTGYFVQCGWTVEWHLKDEV